MSPSNRRQGTKVVMQDLFGNLPVRVKQRPVGEEGQRLREKEWKLLVRLVVGMLLARASRITLTMRETDKDQNVRVRWQAKQHADQLSNPSFDLAQIRNLLVQSGTIDAENWNTWVTTSAKTSSVTIRALFSTEAAPAKDIQFISIGSQAVNGEHGCNVLFDELNRRFAQSSFGLREDKTTENGSPRGRGYRTPTGKQLRGGGKGVDRWPMFYVRIDLNDHNRHSTRNLHNGDGTQLSEIMNILHAMTTTFLTEHNFRPHKRHERKTRSPPQNRSKNNTPSIDESSRHVRPEKLEVVDATFSKTSNARRNFEVDDLGDVVAFPHRSKMHHPSQESEYFGGLGRIKIGPRCHRAKVLDTDNVPKVVDTPVSDNAPSQQSNALPVELASNDEGPDGLIVWTNPVTGDQIVVNKRTGFVVEPKKRQQPELAHSSIPTRDSAQLGLCRLTLSRASSDAAAIIIKSGTWANKLLSEWNNPVFERTEQRIPQIYPQDLNAEHLGSKTMCPRLEMGEQFHCSTGECRLTKDNLRRSEVICQVDSKFILVKVDSCADAGSESAPSDLLLLIDQHAADERIRVEALLAQFCTRPTDPADPAGVCSVQLPNPVTFELRSREHEIFRRHKNHFAEWGIVYSVRSIQSRSRARENAIKWALDVIGLPLAIAERCRIDPKHLIDMLRGEAWKREDSHAGTRTSKPPPNEGAKTDEHWLRKIHDCPTGILDMINSRACRTAIMFNDVLSLDDCTDLVRRLADCQFPFQCAHGRPSMIPLVNFGRDDDPLEGFRPKVSAPLSQDSGFAEKWEAWRNAQQ
ncbi:MAG: DNA mismatch repair protein [Stictis urceolatum]|nr:DNA mismatch repair protein [Stictis urceolata]